MEDNSVKIEVPAKPLLSPTRSVDEGFESDPDRVSTDSEVQHVNTAQQFDLFQRTDREGVIHTQITRRFQGDNNSIHSASEANASKISLICVSGEVVDTSDHTTGNSIQTGTATQSGHHQQPPQKPERTRRSKTKAPPPPTANHRSHSVDSVRFAANNNTSGDLVIRNIDTDTINGDVLSGKFVRVQVDPNQSYYPANQRLNKSLYSVYPSSGSSSLQLWPASSASNFVKVTNRPKQYPQYSQQQHQHQQQSFRPSCNAISSRHHINRISHPVPVCWTQSIPRQARR